MFRVPMHTDGSWLTRWTVALGALLAVVLAACSAPSTTSPDLPPLTRPPMMTEGTTIASQDGPPTVTTTGLDGNRAVPGTLDVDATPVRLDAGFAPTGLVAAPVEGGHLLVATDGVAATAWILDVEGVRIASTATLRELGAPNGGRPTLARDGSRWRFADAATSDGDDAWRLVDLALERRASTLLAGAARIDDLLPDARFALAGTTVAAPVAPTDRYRHGVLGDETEAGALVLADTVSGATERIAFPSDTVLEGLGAMFGDLDGDGVAEPVFTLSGPDAGAFQAAVLDGELIVSPAIGRGNRWRHLLGVSQGRIYEIVTPHLTRVLQVLELRDGELEVVLSVPETIASHRIGSRNLELAALVDVTGDGVVDVIGPAADDETVLRTVDGSTGEVLDELGLGARQNSNLLAFQTGGGPTLAAVGTLDGSVFLLGLQQ